MTTYTFYAAGFYGKLDIGAVTSLDLIDLIIKLDWESIRSSPRDGSSTAYRLTKGWVGFGGFGGCDGLGGWPPRFLCHPLAF